MKANIGTNSCSFCQAATRPTTLGQYGNRCRECFTAYCLEGLAGGPKGFVGGADDTEQQKTMRARVKGNRPVGHAMTTNEEEILAREVARVAAAKAFAAYQRVAK